MQQFSLRLGESTKVSKTRWFSQHDTLLFSGMIDSETVVLSLLFAFRTPGSVSYNLFVKVGQEFCIDPSNNEQNLRLVEIVDGDQEIILEMV